MKPEILITGNIMMMRGNSSFVVAQNYARGVEDAGGIPLLAIGSRSAEDYADRADALLLSGGVDVQPALYGQEPSADNLMLDPERDGQEQSILQAFIARRKPVLGICRGIQFLNVFFKGTLYQDISGMPGGQHAGGVTHMVDIVPDTVLYKLFGGSILANSYHHQAVDRLAPCLKAAAYDRKENGSFLEAFEHPGLPVLGVQWHPERMIAPEALATGLTDMHPLFTWLIETARSA